MKFVYHPDAVLHQPATYFNRGLLRSLPEKPERMDALAGVITGRGHDLIRPGDYGYGPLAAVHTPAYLAYLENAHARWIAAGDMGDVVLPNVSRMQRTPSYPAGIVGQTGWHVFDTAAPIGAGTWAAARAAANAAIHAARLVAEGADTSAYALCRPPGHHATRDQAGGFCYLNHVAIAAQAALPLLARQGRPARVAILDVDLHHGNGTQDIFYGRDDVFFVSVHADPANFYPHMAGYAQERGEGRGEGYTLNLPLPVGSGEDMVLEAIANGLRAVARFDPAMLFVSLGFDTFADDPLAAFGVTTPGFARMGSLIAAAGLPTVLVQEGGYAIDALPANLDSFLTGYGV